MRTLTGPILTALAATNVALAQLVYIRMPRAINSFPGNIAKYSEAFDNAIWTKTNSSIAANNAVAPDGLTVADKLTTSSAQGGAYQTPAGSNNTTYSVSIFAKAGTVSALKFGLTNQSESAVAYYSFNLTTGAISSLSVSGFTSVSASVENHGNGWLRCIVTGASPASGTTAVGMYPRLESIGDAYLWGAQIEQGAATAYKPTVATEVFADVIALSSSNFNIPFGGVIYKGAYGLATISQIEDSPGEVKGLSFQMAGSSAVSIGLALDGADQWQGSTIRIFTCLLSSNYLVTDAVLEWSGFGDTFSIEESQAGATLNASAESSAVDLLRGSILTISNADQRILFPSDRAFEYITDQVGKPVVWPARAYFLK